MKMRAPSRTRRKSVGTGVSWLTASACAALALVVPAAAQSVMCTVASQGYTAYTACPGDQIVAAVQFASYGLPTTGATCGEYAISGCHANNSAQVVSRCLGRTSCALPASNDLFGNPCPWYAGSKWLAFAVRCEPPPPSMTPTPLSSPSNYPVPLVWSDINGTSWYGADLNAACSPGGSADALGLSLLQCRALCAQDAACMGFNYVKATGACTKKCSPTYASIALMPSASIDDICSFAIHPSRLSPWQVPAAPSAAMTPSTTPTRTPAASMSTTRTATATATISGSRTGSPAPSPSTSSSATRSTTPSPSFLPWPKAITHFEATTGSDMRTFTVPATVNVIEVALWGAGGGTMAAPAFGGAGAFVTGMLPVTPGETLRIITGRPGRGCGAAAAPQDADVTDAEAAGGGGGRGFDITVGGMRLCASSGGGRSAIQRRMTVGGVDVWYDVVASGGGGGGVYSYTALQPRGGMASWNATGARGSDLRPTTSGGDSSAAAVGGGGASTEMGGEANAALLAASSALGVVSAPAAGTATRGGHSLFCPNCAYGNASSMGLGYGSGGGGGAFGGGSGGRLGGGGGSSLISNLVDARGETAPAAAPYAAGGRWSRLFPVSSTGIAPGNADMPGHVAIGAPSACDTTGACYASVRRPDGRVISWFDAASMCSALGPRWSLATIASHVHAESIMLKSCLGSIPAQSTTWIGLYEKTGYGTKIGSSTSWTWISGAPNDYFVANSYRYWERTNTEPNNYGAPSYPERFVHLTRAGPAPFSSSAMGLNDLDASSTYDNIYYGCESTGRCALQLH